MKAYQSHWTWLCRSKLGNVPFLSALSFVVAPSWYDHTSCLHTRSYFGALLERSVGSEKSLNQNFQIGNYEIFAVWTKGWPHSIRPILLQRSQRSKFDVLKKAKSGENVGNKEETLAKIKFGRSGKSKYLASMEVLHDLLVLRVLQFNLGCVNQVAIRRCSVGCLRAYRGRWLRGWALEGRGGRIRRRVVRSD